MDFVEVGDNWKNFYWPSQTPVLPRRGNHNVHFLFVNITIISDDCRTHAENVLGVTQQLFHPEGEMERLRQSVTALALVSAIGNLLVVSFEY